MRSLCSREETQVRNSYKWIEFVCMLLLARDFRHATAREDVKHERTVGVASIEDKVICMLDEDER